MKIHIVTVGQPKLAYAKDGWHEYWSRLERFHQIRVTRVADHHNDAEHILSAIGPSYVVALEIEGKQLSSEAFAAFLEQRALESREVCFVIGGPDGLPQKVRNAAQMQMSFGAMTLPHDLAMVVLLEQLFRASSINAGIPYHR
jgi:23S rRNA (pseudouridine1915-N3)-methyltransferase